MTDTLTIHIPRLLADYVEETLGDSGLFLDMSDYVREAVRYMIYGCVSDSIPGIFFDEYTDIREKSDGAATLEISVPPGFVRTLEACARRSGYSVDALCGMGVMRLVADMDVYLDMADEAFPE